ncbi:hypothetical protein SNE40_003188 [Patella caerulea]|uniref:Peptidase metallopeptidase domain-containing protein n=1 Tax=Patella caerulea TaxID=87958 RepID=A0AAN8Q002_PATCE
MECVEEHHDATTPVIIVNNLINQAPKTWKSTEGVAKHCYRKNFLSGSCCWLMLYLFIILFGYVSPTPLRASEKHYRELQAHGLEYLRRFGYLSGASRETGNLMSMEDMSDQIKRLQRLGQIPQTGVIDRRTQELMQKPRCGNSDNNITFGHRKKRYTLAPTKWEKKNLTFRIVNYSPDLPLHNIRNVIYGAFQVWSDVTKLTFTEIMSGEADIMIQFASRYHQDGYPFDGKGMILAHAFFPGSGRGGDTHFDDDERWTFNSSDGVDLFMVAAHEFGHALGLAHSSEPGALMYPWYQGFQTKFLLPRDDIEGIQNMYGPKQGMELPDLPPVKPTQPPKTDNDGNDGDDGYTVNPTDRDPNGQAPDPCTQSFDALTVVRNEVFLFIGNWFWRLDSRNIVRDPINIHQFWYGFPNEIKRIDAVFERKPDGKIVFFAGDKYWVFNANYLVSSFPTEGRPITEFGIPPDVKKIDTVFVWGFNNRTYLVSGDMYWKLDQNNTYVEYDYPRDMSIWRGVPVPVDAAFRHSNGKTYFFYGPNYWEFYDLKMKTRVGYPKPIATDWLNCKNVKSSLVNQVQDIWQKKPDSSASLHSISAIFLAFSLVLSRLWNQV